MNKRGLLILSPITVTVVGVSFILGSSPKQSAFVYAYDTSKLPTTISLKDNTEEEIRNYYSSLNSLSENERQGNNLLKNLKTILKNDQKYYSYDTDNNGRKIWQIYEIADRDWIKSPASELEGYDPSTNTINNYEYGTSASNKGSNPYIHALYVNREAENNVRAWATTSEGKTSHGNNAEWCIDREHIWPKSQGFEEQGKGGARGDPMHLWPGDSDVNSAIHNNNLYGFVNDSKITSRGKWSYGTSNLLGKSTTLNNSNDVFEPQDSDKGDIARSIFYMVARYNDIAGDDTIDKDNPNLELVQDNTVLASYTSSKTVTGKMGILTDLLEWNKLDPVDEFEIHRNNLLFNNYTNNRNPFIDFPEWADYIWGTVEYDGKQFVSHTSTPSGAANPQTDSINDSKKIASLTVSGTLSKNTYYEHEQFNPNGLTITATYDDASEENVTDKINWPTDLEASITTITASYGGKTVDITINPVIQNVLMGISVSGAITEFCQRDSFYFDGTVTATYQYPEESPVTKTITKGYVVDPENGTQLPYAGDFEVTISYTEHDVTKEATYIISITRKLITEESWFLPALIGLGILLVLIVIIIIMLSSKKGRKKLKKAAAKTAKSTVKSFVKSQSKSSSSTKKKSSSTTKKK